MVIYVHADKSGREGFLHERRFPSVQNPRNWRAAQNNQEGRGSDKNGVPISGHAVRILVELPYSQLKR